MVDILTELQRGDADDALRIRVYSDGALRSVYSSILWFVHVFKFSIALTAVSGAMS